MLLSAPARQGRAKNGTSRIEASFRYSDKQIDANSRPFLIETTDVLVYFCSFLDGMRT